MTNVQAQEGGGQSDDDERPRLLNVEIGDWPGLAGNVRLELGGRRTVLVGKNGAGKSLLMEGLERAALQARMASRLGSAAPGRFRCEISISDSTTVTYEYLIFAYDAEVEIDGFAAEGLVRLQSWTESCWRSPEGDELWRVASSQLIVGSREGVLFPPGMGLLAVDHPPARIPAEVDVIRRLLEGFRMVQAGVPRVGARRQEVLVSGVRDAGGERRWVSGGQMSHIAALARWIVIMFEHDRETFHEFAILLRQLELVGEVAVKVYEDPQSSENQSGRRDYASVLFDGVNIGLLSDGTQRVAQILRHLLQKSVTCLLIEEPETAVHPGLLARLLALLESYGYDRQIVVSTHSPQVVDWCKPEELRVIERIEGMTTARSLADADLERVRRYLHEEGTFSEFIYERGDL